MALSIAKGKGRGRAEMTDFYEKDCGLLLPLF
jgi:hypothetical protein